MFLYIVDARSRLLDDEFSEKVPAMLGSALHTNRVAITSDKSSSGSHFQRRVGSQHEASHFLCGSLPLGKRWIRKHSLAGRPKAEHSGMARAVCLVARGVLEGVDMQVISLPTLACLGSSHRYASASSSYGWFCRG